MILDIFNSSGPVLVAVLSAQMGLSNSLVAISLGTYQFMGAFSQPFFGWLADRNGGRWIMGLSVAWTIGFLALSIFAAQTGEFWLFVVPFTLAALGSGAFHPAGTKFSALQSTGRAATATAFFFLFGQLGLATGPVLSGYVLETIGLIGIPIMALLAVPIILFVLTTPVPKLETTSSDVISPDVLLDQPSKNTTSWVGITLLIVHTFFRSWAQIGIVAFVPKLFQDMGWSPTTYGAIVSFMWIASAFSGVVAGNAADRWGRRQVIFWVMILAVVPLYLLPITNSIYAYILALLVGGLTGAPHSITVVIAQDMMPSKQATASGLILGLMFGMGAFATFIIGWLADLWTLTGAMQVGALMALLAAVTALALPSTRTTTVPVSDAEKITV